MDDLVSSLALSELRAAINAVDAPFSTLPEVKDNNGDTIDDVKEKRLALVRRHVQAAGEILHLGAQIEKETGVLIQSVIATRYKEGYRKLLADGGAPQEVLDALEKGVENLCDCPSCQAKREKKQEEEPARAFGFGAITRK